MSNLINGKIPNQAIQTLKIVKDLFGSSIVGVYLFGSAVNGGLRINSDVDVLVVVNHSLPQLTRKTNRKTNDYIRKDWKYGFC
ncbi:nucleotidyltransferase domain protein [Staphylococcus aureus subsp. aureus CIG1605]|nr:nucleotidyltransferase domain protein [Staphylococcus aureus subsp. aureus CIG1605]